MNEGLGFATRRKLTTQVGELGLEARMGADVDVLGERGDRLLGGL